jgi:hypothetical protein
MEEIEYDFENPYSIEDRWFLISLVSSLLKRFGLLQDLDFNSQFDFCADFANDLYYNLNQKVHLRGSL